MAAAKSVKARKTVSRIVGVITTTAEPFTAARSVEHGEEGYATLRRLLTDPKHADHLTGNQLQELTAGADDLRKKLDDVRRRHTQR